MARQAKKSIYEKIEDKKQQIADTEAELKRLNDELQVLFNERTELQKQQLFDRMMEKGLTIDDALNLLMADKTETKTQTKTEKNK